MKKIRILMGLGSVLAGTLLCMGCFNLFEPPVQPRSQAVTVTFTIDGEGGMARSILPLMSQFDRIELSAQLQGGGVILDPVPVTGGSAALTLGAGSWDVTANAYLSPESGEPAAAAFSVITNTDGSIEGDRHLSLQPVGTGPGTLHYAVTLPSVNLTVGASRIQVELQGEVQDSQTIDESSSSGEFSLAPGIYAADIVLTNAAGKTAAYREAVSILSGLTTEITFGPKAEEFLDPGARALLTTQVLFGKTKSSSSVTFTTGGSDVSRTLNIAALRGNDTIYFVVKKLAAQTLTVSGTDAARVRKSEGANGLPFDGVTPSSTETVIAVDIPDLAEIGGTVSFVITAGENGKTPIETAVTITLPHIVSLVGGFIRFGQSYQVTYRVGDDFDYESFVVNSLNSDGSTVTETVYTIEGFDTTTPGAKTIRLSKNGMYGKLVDFANHNAQVDSIVIYVVDWDSRLVFDYGNWSTSAVPALVPPGGYTTPLGRPLVLAPVKWNMPDNAVYEWKVDGVIQFPTHSVTSEYFSFNPSAKGEYTVTVTATLAGGQTVSATTKITCCDPEGTFKDTATSWGSYWQPGQAPTMFNEPGDYRYGIGGGGFGGAAGSKIFTQSLQNSGSWDLRIVGNAFGEWTEPGIVWVAQDSNGNGIMDDTWYELKGDTEGNEIVKRYAVTFYSNGAWQDNLGGTGYVPGGPVWYPRGITHDWITLTNTCIVAWADAKKLTGYVDTLSNQLFKISNAVQADGSPVNLAYIDFVVVKTGAHQYTPTGELSTEIYGGINAYNPYDPERTLAGTGSNGVYTYKLVNNAGYELTVPVAVLNGVFTNHILSPGASETFTLNEATAYFDYFGGSAIHAVSGNTVTFSDRPE